MHISSRMLALGATSILVLAACSSAGASKPPSAAPSAAATAAASEAASVAPSAAAVNWKACVAFDTGGLGDKGFNDLAMKGLNDAKALGYTIAFSESKGATDYAANIQRLIDESCRRS